MTCREIMDILEELSPKAYAEEWDNVGLLVGRADKEVHRIMIALDANERTIVEAIKMSADLLITHHPIIFKGIKTVNDDSPLGNKIVALIENGINCYAMHTNFDICGSMGDAAADILGLNITDSIEISSNDCSDEEAVPKGIGKIGYMDKDMKLKDLGLLVKERFALDNVSIYGEDDKTVIKVAISPGSGKSMIDECIKKGCQVLITGDIGHHEGLDAVDAGLSIIDATHYGLEHIFMEYIEEYLKDKIDNDIYVQVLDLGCPVHII